MVLELKMGSVDELMREAFATQEAGDLAGAEKLYRELLARHPVSADANFMLGEILSNSGRNEQALEFLRAAVRYNPEVAVFHYTFGCALQACGKAEEAMASYRSAIRRDGAHVESWNNLGSLLLQEGNLKEARTGLERAVALAPGFIPALFNLGEVCRAQQDWAEAARRFGAIPNPSREVLDRLVEVLGRQGKYEMLPGIYREIARLALSAPGTGAGEGKRPDKVAVNNTTLCCIDCSYHDLAIHALQHSLGQCTFDRVLFLTDKPFTLPGIEVVTIPKIASVAEYSEFVLKRLCGFIHTDFALLIQYDGYVLDGSGWAADFHEYDYIGARWPGKTGHSVGNGGFSLRSKRLLEALQDERCIPSSPEDAVICLQYRDFLESKYGIRFAPEAVADRFSFEGIPRRQATFGFHGVGHLVALAGKSAAEIAAYRGENTRLVGQE